MLGDIQVKMDGSVAGIYKLEIGARLSRLLFSVSAPQASLPRVGLHRGSSSNSLTSQFLCRKIPAMAIGAAILGFIIGVTVSLVLGVIASLVLGVITSLVANALDRYCIKTYQCGFVEFICLRAPVIQRRAIARIQHLVNLFVRMAEYTYWQACVRILAAKELVILEAKLYRLILESWWASLLNSYSKIKDVANADVTLATGTLATLQPLPFSQSRLVRIAAMAMVSVAIVVIPSFFQKTHQELSSEVAEVTFPQPRFSAEHAIEELDPGPGEWTYRGARSEEQGTRLEIFHNGQKAFSHETGAYLDFVTFDDQSDGGFGGIVVEGAGKIYTKDITGDRVPDVLLVEDCGCSAGFMTYTLWSLDQQVKETFTTDDWLGEGAWQLEDLDGDGVYEAVGPEFPIMIREEGYKWAGPSIKVILKYDRGRFTFASDLMRREPPTRSDFLAQIEKAKRELGDYEIPLDTGSYYTEGLPDSVSAYAINLIYTGNGELAHEFINLVFSGEEPEQREFFWRYFYTDLSGKHYWPQIAAMNHWSVGQYSLGNTC